MNPVTQHEFNKPEWSARDTFRGVVDPLIYKDLVLTMLFLKHISDVWEDHKARYETEYLDAPEIGGSRFDF